MASITTALRKYLLSESSVSSLVGDRIYPVHAVEKPARPFVTYRTTGGSGDQQLSGALVSESTRIYYEVESEDFEEAENVAIAIKNVIMRPQTKGAYYGCAIIGFELGAIESTVVPPVTGSDQRKYVSTIDFLIQHLPQ